ncbi:MAG: NUDIX hydrolase [Defluviitaleaceae bacterium]|nr:NUDIX hydrolase [Defluviitaleaceae bacterium]
MKHPTHIVAAAGYIFDKDGNMLLVHIPWRGWDTPGGQVEVGESLEEGVLREVLEESGVTVSIKCLAGVYSNIGQRFKEDGSISVPTKVMFDFICDYVDGEAKAATEATDIVWVPQNEVMVKITTPVLRYRFEKILNFNGKVVYSSYITQPEFKLITERYI